MTTAEKCKMVMAFLVFAAGITGLFCGYPGIENSGQVLWIAAGLIIAGAGAVGIKITSLLGRNGGGGSGGS